jgi:hypothetical protein
MRAKTPVRQTFVALPDGILESDLIYQPPRAVMIHGTAYGVSASCALNRWCLMPHYFLERQYELHLLCDAHADRASYCR